VTAPNANPIPRPDVTSPGATIPTR
jgi:hypothetical protein